MRRALLPLLIATAAVPAAAAPVKEPDRWALGLMVGGPTGLTLKRYLGGEDAIDGGIGFVGPGVRLHADYLWGLAQLLSDPRDLRLNAYAGAGGMLGVCEGPYGPFRVCSGGAGGVYVGARVPVGLELVLRKAPLAFGLEAAPGLAFGFGSARGLLDVTLHVRLLL